MKNALEKSSNGIMGKEDDHTRLIFEASPNMIIMFDSSFAVIDCNSSAVEFLGFKSKEELLAGFFQRVDLVTPMILSDGRASPSVPEQLCIVAGEGHSMFETEIHMNGQRNLNVILNRIPYETDFVIISYCSDVTHIHEREMELLRARKLNELQLAKLNLVVQATKIGLFEMEAAKDDLSNKTNTANITDIANMANTASPASKADIANTANTVVWSDELRHMLGFTTEAEFPDVLSSFSDRLFPDDREAALGGLSKHMLDKTGKTPYDVEFRLRSKDGGYPYFRATGETIRDERGNPLRVVGSLMDITETKNILLDTERQRVEAEAANQAKSAFLSSMSHEIRTPMNVILGITEIQLQNEKLDPEIKEAFERIYASSDLLLGIINDILDLSKIEAGKFDVIISDYKIANLLSDATQLNMMRIGSKPIQFELFVDEEIPANLRGDELRVKQILNNLLSNAFKYTASGTVKLSVTFEHGKPGEPGVPDEPGKPGVPDEPSEPGEGGDNIVVIFTVSDTGQGMTKEQVAMLYDEYSRFNLETNRTTEGTGLGMSITRNLITMMNGDISIESEPGKGSVFTVRLPQGKVDSEALGAETIEKLRQFRKIGRAQMKRMQVTREPMPYGSVIVVDDVEANIYVAKGLLAPYELEFDSASSGFEVIEKIRNGKLYDIIFMDHMMPKMDGIEATKIIRDMGYEHPVVALTASAVAGQAEIFLKNGFDGFITKPIDLRQLNEVLNKLIRDKQPPEVLEAAKRQAESNKQKAAGDLPLPEISPKFTEVFLRDASKAIDALNAVNEKDGVYDEEDIRSYIIYTHGIKSALTVIGQMRLAAAALKLELLGREGNNEAIAEEIPAFLDSLRALVRELKPTNETGDGEEISENQPYLRKKLLEAKAACEVYDAEAAEDIVIELRGKIWPKQTQAFLAAIANDLLHGDFEEVANAIEKSLA